MQYIYIYIYFGGGGLGGGRDYFFLGLKSYFLKYKRNIRVESPISENIRKFCYARIWIFFSWSIRKFRFLKYKDFWKAFEKGNMRNVFWENIKKSFLLRKHNFFFNIRARKFHFRKFLGFGLESAGFHFLKYKKSFLLRKYNFFLISKLESSI